MNQKAEPQVVPQSKDPMCFIIMPIADPDSYTKGHFSHVYKDIIQPACSQAGFKPVRADEVKQSNLIHLDILQKLLEAPMAVCDLSNRNPNVLFELALRQAFDKPVALIQEVGTPPIFDIAPLRYTEYRKERIYHEVIEDQQSIATTIAETFKSSKSGTGINSIVKLLALSKSASIPEIGHPEAKADLQQFILAELSQLKDELRQSRQEGAPSNRKPLRRDLSIEWDQIRDMLAHIEYLLERQDDPYHKHAELMLNDCRQRFYGIIPSLNEATALPSAEQNRVFDLDKRISSLERVLNEKKGIFITTSRQNSSKSQSGKVN